MVSTARRAARLASAAVDRGAEGEPLKAVADLAEAVRCAQHALHEAVRIGRDAGVGWRELATYTGTSAEYLEHAHTQFDPQARLHLPAGRSGWRPLG